MSFLRKRTFVVHVQFYNEAAENDVFLSVLLTWKQVRVISEVNKSLMKHLLLELPDQKCQLDKPCIAELTNTLVW